MEGRAALHDPVRSFILSGVPAGGSARRFRPPASAARGAAEASQPVDHPFRPLTGHHPLQILKEHPVGLAERGAGDPAEVGAEDQLVRLLLRQPDKRVLRARRLRQDVIAGAGKASAPRLPDFSHSQG